MKNSNEKKEETEKKPLTEGIKFVGRWNNHQCVFQSTDFYLSNFGPP